MQRRIGLWALVGFIVASVWVILSFAILISPQPVLWGLARVTCPILPISLTFHFGVKWYWFVTSNVAAYALIGLVFESLELLRHRLQAAPRFTQRDLASLGASPLRPFYIRAITNNTQGQKRSS